MIMFKIIIMDGKQKIPNDDICYLISKNGIMIKKKLGLIDCIVPVDTISVLEDIKPYAKMSIPKIPADIFAQITAFFRAIYDEYRAESMALMFLNPKTNEYYIHIPYQKVSTGGIEYHRGFVLENYVMVCSIHSHANFGAFHSGTDHDDEKNFDGLHITIGKLGNEFVEIASSIMANGTRFKVDPLDYIEGITEIDVEDKEEEEMFYYIGSQKIKISGRKKLKNEKQYFVESVSFNPEWMEHVEGTKYIQNIPYRSIIDDDDEFSMWSYYKHFGDWSVRNMNNVITASKEIKEEDIITGPCKICPFKNNISNNLKIINSSSRIGEIK